eukprot:Awhi_evm1s6892
MVNHIALALTDIAASEHQFYTPLLKFLGFENEVSLIEGEQLMSAPFSMWTHKHSHFSVNLWKAKVNLPHERYSPGMQHMAFNAGCRQDVDDAYTLMSSLGAEVTQPPREYPYMAGYYAVFFKDPD